MKLPLSASILLGFAPYIAFFALMRGFSVEAGLWGAFAVAVLVGAQDKIRGGSWKILEVGAVVMFAGLAAFTWASHWEWTIMSVRLAVDFGLLTIVVLSLAIGQPFTLQYARERVGAEAARSALFLSVNRHITLAWAAAFAILVTMHAVVVFVPAVPVLADLVVTIATLFSAYRFSTWYPAHTRKQAGLAQQTLGA